MAEVTGIREFSVSWSSLRYWTECKQLAYLVRERKKNPVQDTRNFFHGNVVDRIMRNWLTMDEPEAGLMPRMVDEYMEKCEQEVKEKEDGRIKWRHRTDKQEVRDFCVELVTRLEPILFEEVIPYEYEPAKRFAVPVKETTIEGEPIRIILKGEYDLLVRNPETGLFRVWDLKATKDNNYWRKTFGQLIFYDLATFAMFPEVGAFPEQSGLIQPMCDERVKRFEFSNDDRAKIWSDITRMAETMWKGDYAPKEDAAGCYNCVVRHACSKFKPTKSLNGKKTVSFGREEKCDRG